MKFTAWSPSRLADYEQCPALAKWKHLEKLCPLCFRGRMAGGHDEPVTCDTCGATVTPAAPLVRGSAIGKAMEQYLKGETPVMPLEVISDVSRKIAASVRKMAKEAKAKIELMVTLDKDWKLTSLFSGSAWLRAKMDATCFHPRGRVHVIDWKTGGIDKKTGAPREEQKHDDQLSIYTTAALSAFPSFSLATASLVFLDAAKDPIVERESASLQRENLGKAHERWNKRVLPMMNDDLFAPSPSRKCSYCDYSKEKGGPCQF